MEGRPMEVKEDVWKFFEDFGEEDQQRPCLNEVNFKKISSEDNSVLISRFGEEEIKETIWDCGSSKSQKRICMEQRYLNHQSKELLQIRKK